MPACPTDPAKLTSPATPEPLGVPPFCGFDTLASGFRVPPVALTYVPKLEVPPAEAAAPLVLPAAPPAPIVTVTVCPVIRPVIRFHAYPPPDPPPLPTPASEY